MYHQLFLQASLKKIEIFLAFFASIFLSACFQHYYKAIPQKTDNNSQSASVIESLSKANRYFILRNGEAAFHIKNISITPDKKTAELILDSLPDVHKKYVNIRNEDVRYKPNSKTGLNVLNEAHIYITPNSSVAAGPNTIQLDRIESIEVIKNDSGKTTFNHIASTIGFIFLAFCALFIGLGGPGYY